MRSRLPNKFAMVQVALHAVALVCSIATVCVAVYASVRYDYAKEMIGAYVAAIWTILLDSAEITVLSDTKRRFKRLSPGWLGLVEFLTFIFCVVAPDEINIHYNGLYFECGGRPVDECTAIELYRERGRWTPPVTIILQRVVGALHCLFACFSCVYCYRHRRG